VAAAQVALIGRRRALLDQLLMVALHRAVALAQVHGMAVGSANTWISMLAAASDELSRGRPDRRRTPRGLAWASRRSVDLGRAPGDPHCRGRRTAVLGLEQHRNPTLRGNRRASSADASTPSLPGMTSRPAARIAALARVLEPISAVTCGVGADEGHAMLGAQRGEQWVLRQKAPSRGAGAVTARLDGRLDDAARRRGS